MPNWKSNLFLSVFVLTTVFLYGCAIEGVTDSQLPGTVQTPSDTPLTRAGNAVPVIHVTVALCDNENQGIVPVPEHLGNGEDPDRNLYWGAAYGVETYFSKSNSWQRLADPAAPKSKVLKRIAFKHLKTGAILIADAYRGVEIKTSIVDFLESSAGNNIDKLEIDGKDLQIGGGADVIVYVGHNGLMDFKVEKPSVSDAPGIRDAIILACFSKRYFGGLLKETGSNPILWTSNLMAPEAYILHDALEGRLAGEDKERIRDRAAGAYSRYQKISMKASKRLLVTGWQ